MYLRAARSMAAFAGMCDGGPTDACVTGSYLQVCLQRSKFYPENPIYFIYQNHENFRDKIITTNFFTTIPHFKQ